MRELITDIFSFDDAYWQINRHVQVDATILAGSVERLLYPLWTERQIDAKKRKRRFQFFFNIYSTIKSSSK